MLAHGRYVQAQVGRHKKVENYARVVVLAVLTGGERAPFVKNDYPVIWEEVTLAWVTHDPIETPPR